MKNKNNLLILLDFFKKPTQLLGVGMVFSFLLSACGSTTTYENGEVRAGPAIQGAAVGLLAGAATGAIVGTNISTTSLVGGVVGAVVWPAMKEARGARARLERVGVQVVQVGEAVSVYIPVDQCFDPASDEVLESCHPMLNQVVVLLRTFNPNTPMTISGHTDDVGSVPHKAHLSDHQARAIAAYLWAHGVPCHQLKVMAEADCDPVASNRNSLGSAANRRVQIDIRPQLMK